MAFNAVMLLRTTIDAKLVFFSLEFFLESVFKKKIDLVTQNALKEQLKNQILKQVSFV
jgi:predicted nucleotidyltransferase